MNNRLIEGLAVPTLFLSLTSEAIPQTVSSFGEGASNASACGEAQFNAALKCPSGRITEGTCSCTHGSNLQKRLCDVVAQCDPLTQSEINERERLRQAEADAEEARIALQNAVNSYPVLPGSIQSHIDTILTVQSQYWAFSSYQSGSASRFRYGPNPQRDDTMIAYVNYQSTWGTGAAEFSVRADGSLCITFWDKPEGTCDGLFEASKGPAAAVASFLSN